MQDVRSLVGSGRGVRALEVQSRRQGERPLELRPHRIAARRDLLGHARADDPGGADLERDDVIDETSERRIG